MIFHVLNGRYFVCKQFADRLFSRDFPTCFTSLRRSLWDWRWTTWRNGCTWKMLCNCITFFLVVPLEQFLAPGQHAALCLELGREGREIITKKMKKNLLRYTEILYLEYFGIIWICVHHSSCACSYIFRWSTSHCFEPRHNARRMALRRVSHQAGHELLYWQLLRTNWLLWNRTKHQKSNESWIFVVELQLVFFLVFPTKTKIKQFLSEVWGVTRRSEWFHQFCAKALARLSFVRDCCAIFSVHRQCLGFVAWLVFPPKKWGKLIRPLGYAHSRCVNDTKASSSCHMGD